jgi:hypothetical protein
MKASEILDAAILDKQPIKSTYFPKPKEGEDLLISRKIYNQLCNEYYMNTVTHYKGYKLKIAE